MLCLFVYLFIKAADWEGEISFRDYLWFYDLWSGWSLVPSYRSLRLPAQQEMANFDHE